jgi:hypothetical protein
MTRDYLLCVMAGLVPVIHAFRSLKMQVVDARHKVGHDSPWYVAGP